MTVIGDKNIKEIIGEVISTKMNLTCVVLVKSVRMHPLYKKRYVVRKKYYAHNDGNKAELGNTVKIRSVSPISKTKKRNVIEIL